MNQIDLVIFDCDGVLVDSEPIAAAVTRKILATVGWDLSVDEIMERFLGASNEEFRSQVEAFLDAPLPVGWDDDFAHWYRDAFESDLRAIDGIEHALDVIDLATCVASNSGHERVRTSLALTGLLSRFDGNIYSAQDVERGKPFPDLFLWAAEKSGVAPANCVVVEDSPYGVAAARAAGMRVFAYAAGTASSARLEGPATTIFRDMKQLPALVDRSSGRR